MTWTAINIQAVYCGLLLFFNNSFQPHMTKGGRPPLVSVNVLTKGKPFIHKNAIVTKGGKFLHNETYHLVFGYYVDIHNNIHINSLDNNNSLKCKLRHRHPRTSTTRGSFIKRRLASWLYFIRSYNI